MKISLVRCPCINLPYPPPIGLAYISSSLKAAGHEVFIFDLNVEFFHHAKVEDREKWVTSDVNSLIALAESINYKYEELVDHYIRKILDTQAEIIGFSVWNTNSLFSLRLAEEIKRRDKNRFVVFGGPECFPRWSGMFLIQNEAVDAVVYGEGEETLKEISSSLEKSGKVEFPQGSIIRKGSKEIDCGPRRPIEDLNALPFPDFTDFPMDKYLTHHLPIVFSRGCPRKCSYCSTPGTTPGYRWRHAKGIFEEIKSQLQKHPDKVGFDLYSPALNSNIEELSKLCDFILQDKMKFGWSGFAIIDPGMKSDLLKKMRKAGCSGLNFGIESGSQKIINRMRKGFRIEDAERLIRDAHNAEMETVVNFIIGFPDETEGDFQETMEFISRNSDYIS